MVIYNVLYNSNICVPSLHCSCACNSALIESVLNLASKVPFHHCTVASSIVLQPCQISLTCLENVNRSSPQSRLLERRVRRPLRRSPLLPQHLGDTIQVQALHSNAGVISVAYASLQLIEAL